MALLRIVVSLCVVLGAGVASAQPRLTFKGNSAFSAKELRAAIDDPFDAGGALVQEVFERDLLLLSAFYWDRGYVRVRVGDPQITPDEIVIPITENERFTYGAIAVTGDPSPRTNTRHRDTLRSSTGAIFSRRQISDDRQQISRYYEQRGFANVNVLPRTKTDVATRTVELTFEITPGPIAYVEAITVDCPRVPDAASVLTVFVHDRYDVRTFEGSKAAIRRRGGLAKEVVMWMKRGSSDALVILNFECAD
jgi:outer membrane protein insertion porin family